MSGKMRAHRERQVRHGLTPLQQRLCEQLIQSLRFYVAEIIQAELTLAAICHGAASATKQPIPDSEGLPIIRVGFRRVA